MFESYNNKFRITFFLIKKKNFKFGSGCHKILLHIFFFYH